MERQLRLQQTALYLLAAISMVLLSACAHQPPASHISVRYDDRALLTAEERREHAQDLMRYKIPASLCGNANYRACLAVSQKQCMQRVMPFGKDCLNVVLEADARALEKGRLGRSLHKQMFCLVDKGLIYSPSSSLAIKCLSENLVGSSLSMEDYYDTRWPDGRRPCTVTLKDGSIAAFTKHAGKPEYPKAALQRKQIGSVVVAGRIDDEGRVENIRVIRSTNADVFNAAALASIESMRFCRPSEAPEMPRDLVRSIHFNL